MKSGDQMFRESLQAQITDALGHEPYLTDNGKIDLRDSDLSGHKLMSVDLKGADLEGAYFKGSDLALADLSGANFSRTKLDGADLKGACLIGARNLSPHQLAQAKNLEHAYMDPGRYADAVAAGYRPSK